MLGDEGGINKVRCSIFGSACYSLLQQYQIINAYLDLMDNISWTNIAILHAFLQQGNVNVDRQVWAYSRNQHYFNELFESPPPLR